MYNMCIGLLPIKKRTSLNLYNLACRSECSKELFYCGTVWRKQFFILRKVLCIVRELVAWAMPWHNFYGKMTSKRTQIYFRCFLYVEKFDLLLLFSHKQVNKISCGSYLLIQTKRIHKTISDFSYEKSINHKEKKETGILLQRAHVTPNKPHIHHDIFIFNVAIIIENFKNTGIFLWHIYRLHKKQVIFLKFQKARVIKFYWKFHFKKGEIFLNLFYLSAATNPSHKIYSKQKSCWHVPMKYTHVRGMLHYIIIRVGWVPLPLKKCWDHYW